MNLHLTYHNPISSRDEVLVIYYPNVDYGYYLQNMNITDDVVLCVTLDDCLSNLRCDKVVNGVQVFSTKYPNYSINLSRYYFYLSKLRDYVLYNKYVDKLINQHIDNIKFETEFHSNNVINKLTKKKHKTRKNKFSKLITKDLFTGEDVYVYHNNSTGEEITSDNGELLDKLNKPIKKEKKAKRSVDFSNITFKFK